MEWSNGQEEKELEDVEDQLQFGLQKLYNNNAISIIDNNNADYNDSYNEQENEERKSPLKLY